MAKRRSDTDGKNTSNIGTRAKLIKVPFSEYRFVRIEPTEDEKQRFKSLLESGEFEQIPLDEWLEQGYKLSVNRDEQHNTVIVSLTGQYTHSRNSGLVLTARGRDAITALSFLAYKDVYLCDDGEWAACELSRGGTYSQDSLG